MMKQKLKNIIITILFLVVFVISFHFVNDVFRQKAGVNDTIGSFYKEKEDTIDVIFVGSSHAYRAFNPMSLWNDYGITSYDLCTVSQSIPCSYYLIKEAIRLQHPKTIVLETYSSVYMKDYYKAEYVLHAAFDGMPLNKTKLEMLTEYLPYTMDLKEIMSYAIPLIGMHGRWEELQTEDFVPQNQFMKGFQYIETVREANEPPIIEEGVEIYDRNLEYFDRIVEICNQNNVNLIVTQTPMADSERYEDICKHTNTFLKYAEEAGIPCINMDRMREELGIQYDHDFYNETHLNSFGAEKCTNYIAQYLKEHYDLVDHRNDEAYVSWAKAYQEYSVYSSDDWDNVEDDEM